jgi:HD-like signal output (HDOD) protein
MRLDPQALVRGVLKVASLPAVIERLNTAIADPRTGSRDLERIVGEDAALAARLLRIANSALFGFPGRIETLSHAITVIGTQQLRDLALACSVTSLFRNIPRERLDMESFWRHSVACGCAARLLASLRRETNVERHFVAGLLHDIGRLVLLSEAPREAQAVLQEAGERGELLYRIEYDRFEFDHAQLGGLLLEHWRLPAAHVAAVRHHHAPGRADGYKVEASLVHLADVVVHAVQYGNSGERFVPPLADSAWQALGFSPAITGPLLEQLAVQYSEAVQFLMAKPS